MHLKTKIVLLSMTGLFSVAGVAGYGTYALFSAQAANTGNTFSAGTLKISLDQEDPSGKAYFNVTNMAPGDSQVQPVTISSTGSLALYYKISVKFGGVLGTYDDNHLEYTVYPTLVDANAGTNAIDPTKYRALDADGGAHVKETLYVKITLPRAADDAYQNQSGTAVIAVNAVQQRNNLQGTSSGLQMTAQSGAELHVGPGGDATELADSSAPPFSLGLNKQSLASLITITDNGDPTSFVYQSGTDEYMVQDKNAKDIGSVTVSSSDPNLLIAPGPSFLGTFGPFGDLVIPKSGLSTGVEDYLTFHLSASGQPNQEVEVPVCVDENLPT